ncbi:hypothetical protein HPB52_002106 [Rhipicephalus sanguineus]|uniref:Reverse transcriptase domain-containing protein n=1 Tax=Rhipicephalus sanguineus TaxID=34632 RepID=A0A9D4PS67_RHISA|nr:hypothetical protein HPB52_002106 [Rhipicephalus sanguineus]
MQLTKGRLRAALGAFVVYALIFDYAVYVWSPWQNWPEIFHKPNQLRLLLVADSRLSYSPGLSLPAWDDERFVRRTYLAALEHVQPHAIAFLGDLFSEPPVLSNDTRELGQRFWGVFAPLNESTAAARKATAPEADRVVLECIEALPSKLASSGCINLRGIVSSLQEKNYKLLQSGKEGAFVVVHPDQYRLLSDKALSENFKVAEEFHPSKVDIVRVVKKGIEEHGVVCIQNTIGTSASRFEELLVLYLRSTAAEHNEQMYVQRNGVCIGSRIAPVLSDMLLAHYDGILDEKLQSAGWVRIFRYVDDFLVLFRVQPEEATCEGERILDPSREPPYKPSASQHSRASGQPPNQGIASGSRRYGLHLFDSVSVVLPGERDLGMEPEDPRTASLKRAFRREFGVTQPRLLAEGFELFPVDSLVLEQLTWDAPVRELRPGSVRVMLSHVPVIPLLDVRLNWTVTLASPDVIFSAHELASALVRTTR